MGGLFSSPKAPTPPPAPAKPVTAVAKTPTLELEDTELETASDKLGKGKKGKKALKAGMQDPATQTGAEGGAMSGVQIQN
jgi:hypothetical protein